MTVTRTDDRPRQQTLRLWPGVVAVALQWLAWLVLPTFMPEASIFGVIGGLLGGLAVGIWWVFFSRAPRFERWGAAVLTIVALAATPRVLHESVATAGMGVLFFIYAIPVLSLALVVWAVASRSLPDGPRRAALVATILLACGGWALVRTGGVTGDSDSDFAWRWAVTPEQRLLAVADDDPIAPSDSMAAVTEADWPGFRGPGRDGVVRGVKIETDWAVSPPVELWRRPIGPGWSSFAVGGDFLYTQEQRGADEIVASYNVNTGEPVWRHRDAVRFWESNGGAGPRATPTLRDGRLYTFGATGLLNALNAGDGSVIWSRNVALDTGAEVPIWGFASSPLVVGDVVIVAAASQLAGYDFATGEHRWSGEASREGYSSPHLLTIDGVEQVLLMRGAGLTSVAPADGTVLWRHPFPGAPIVQPALTANGDILIAPGGPTGGIGTRRITVTHGSGGWTAAERWTSIRLKSYFSDFVVHKGSAYGFDGSILASMNLEHGERNWKGGRYGHGQLVLLPDQDVLLVVTEEGELVLVAATPDQFTELARFPALEGKTWNHPVLVDDVLLVRNGQEMVAFRLALARSR